jgi:2-dehydropantoate 2-reductase
VNHAILGVGAVGGLVGTALATLGESVTFIVRPESLASYPSIVTLIRTHESMEAPVKVTVALSDPVDVLWVATRAYQLHSSLDAVRAVPGCVVPLLDGVDHVETLRARLGNARVVPGTIGVEAERIAPGRFLQRSSFVNLDLATSGKASLASIVTGLSGLGFTSRFFPREQTMLWSKLCFIAPFALVTTASGMSKGEVTGSSEWDFKVRSAIAEACAVANASGAEIDPAQPHETFDSLSPGIRSPMERDLAAGRGLELDAISGPIVRGGKLYGIDVNTTLALTAMVRAKSGASQPRQ